MAAASLKSDGQSRIATLPVLQFLFSPMAAEVHTATALDARTDDFGAVYAENYHLLVRTAVKHYHISELDAESLAHEVFLAYFLKAHEVNNSRAWLISAICNATKYFLRKRARDVPLPPAWNDIPPELKATQQERRDAEARVACAPRVALTGIE